MKKKGEEKKEEQAVAVKTEEKKEDRPALQDAGTYKVEDKKAEHTSETEENIVEASEEAPEEVEKDETLPKSFELVEAEVNEILNQYFEKNEVPFAWEAKILMDIVSAAIHDQFAQHEEDIVEMRDEIDLLKDKLKYE